ncbi:MAG: DNA-directed RNA polymerase subunit beta', partial [Acidimicrobiales bacterium]
VIVVGPTLKLHQCGLPKQMALELFKPFVMKALVDRELAQNIKSAKRMVERRRPQVWDVLEEVIKEHPVLLNRAPTLHRLGIQAFEPVLVEGKAIQIHPLVCTAFNADFDGDQMAVHLPLSAEAQAESRVLMLSANNVLSPAHGRPLVTPTQDMVIGAYYLTEQVDGAKGEGRTFGNRAQMERAYDAGDVNLHAKVRLRLSKREVREEIEAELRDPADIDSPRPIYRESTVGRFIFNRALPLGFGFVDEPVKKKNMGDIVDHLARDYPKAVVQDSLDRLKSLCFGYAARSGLTISIDDVKTPPSKKSILDRYEKEAEKVENQFRRGIITDGERRQKEVEIWTNATDEVRAAMEKGLQDEQFNPIDMMVGSGARGNMMQVRQIAGMRGLVANPRGDMIPRPIKSNFREGLSMLAYFIATPGARKGLVDTALRTAHSGYLTRRLVDVAQELIVREIDCQREGEPLRGLWIEGVVPDEPGKRSYLETRIFGRALVNPVTLSKDNPHPELAGATLEPGTYISEDELDALRDDPDVDRVRVRSVLTCQADFGVCATCYGRSLATGRLIELGEAVGVIAAQSIGEPGTQLTMRTFHTGGIAGSDIAGGLPRVVELFEARSPKGKATLSHISGVVRIADDEGRGRVITVVADDGGEHAYTVPTIARLEVTDGQEISAGDAIVDGPRDPKELLEIKGVRETQQYLVTEVQRVYRDQGVSIHDKHIELIVRQMTRRVVVQEPGDSRFLPGEAVDAKAYTDENKLLVQEGKTPAEGRPVMMGITKASLATESWLSAASFQETTRVLTEAAIESKSDGLNGLKENIIIGKLIPAGTGMEEYNDIGTEAPEYKPMEYWSSEREDQGIAEWLTGTYEAGAGEAPGNGDLAAVVGLPSSGRGEAPEAGSAG